MPTYISPNGDFVIDDRGNFAMGTQDIENWDADYKAIQLSAVGSLVWSVAGSDLMLVSNAYIDDADGLWKYRAAGLARRIWVSSSATLMQHAISGSADGTITWITDLTA